MYSKKRACTWNANLAIECLVVESDLVHAAMSDWRYCD